MSKKHKTVIAVASDGTEQEFPIAAMVKGTPEHARHPITIDTTEWTRLAEVCAYAERHNVTLSDAIRQLVNHALSSPAPTRQSWKADVEAGADALEEFGLGEDFTRSGLRKLAKAVLLGDLR